MGLYGVNCSFACDVVSGDLTDMGVISLYEHKLERYDNSMERKQPCFSKTNFARYQNEF